MSASATFVEFLMYAEDWEALSQEGRKAFEKFPKETAFLEMASVGDYNLKRYDDVLQICEKVLEVAPNDSSKTLRAWSTIGDIWHQKGEAKKSYKAYEKALKINPDYIYVLNNYAYYLSLLGERLDEAEQMSYRTVKAEPENATYLDTYAWILYHLGNYKDALFYIERAMSITSGENKEITEHFHAIKKKLGL